MTNSSIIDKVRKLLRLADSPNPNEAAAAAAKAQELIDQYKLNMELLTLDGAAPEPEEPIENFRKKDAPLDPGKKADTWRWRLANTVMRANACRGFTSGGDIHIVGRPSDVETVRYLFAYLKAEVEQLTERDGKGCGRTWRNNYRLGVIDTIARKFREQHDAFKKDAQITATAAGSLALVRINTALARVEQKGSAVDAWIKSNMKLRSGGSASSAYDSSARERGREAGKVIQISRARRSLTGS